MLAADWVMIGTTSPTWSRAVWLSSTMRRGVEITLVWVRPESALEDDARLRDWRR